MKALGKRLAALAGYQIRRLQTAGGPMRPIGDQDSVFADFKARGFDPSLIFDVGAATGTWTASVRKIFPDAKYVTVEPRQTKFAPTVRAAVGAQAGTGTLTDWKTGSTLLATGANNPDKYEVPVTTLDRLAEDFGVPDLVKLDVEGYELEALKGASRLIGRTELFVMEVALYRFSGRPMMHEALPFMAERGYFLYDISGFIRRPSDGAVAMMDLCFSRTLRGSETDWAVRSR
jgi:hypothetical protein